MGLSSVIILCWTSDPNSFSFIFIITWETAASWRLVYTLKPVHLQSFSFRQYFLPSWFVILCSFCCRIKAQLLRKCFLLRASCTVLEIRWECQVLAVAYRDLRTIIQAPYFVVTDKAVWTPLLVQYLYSFSVPKDKTKLASSAVVIGVYGAVQSLPANSTWLHWHRTEVLQELEKTDWIMILLIKAVWTIGRRPFLPTLSVFTAVPLQYMKCR